MNSGGQGIISSHIAVVAKGLAEYNLTKLVQWVETLR